MLALVMVPTLLAGAYALTRAGSGNPGGSADSGAGAQAPANGAGETTRGTEGPDPPERAAAPIPPPAASCDDLRVLVDRNNPLPAGYAPGDLVPLSARGIPTLNGQEMLLRRAAARQLGRLMRGAARAGEELVVASAYRSYAEQQASYDNWTAYYGAGAGGVSAPPGHSQHQLGTAVDFTNAEAGYQLWWPFGDTSASAWLMQNAHRYGYVLAYPGGGDTAESGYSWEPWHYRFIGVANARRWHESGLSLQQFLAHEGVLPRCGAV